MSVSIRNRRRVSLLASSSLVAASLFAGVAGLSSLAIAPGVAMAADECGDPSANAGGNDVFTCAGAYVTIDYTATTNGNLTLNIEDGIVVTNGIAATGNAGENLTVRATTNVVGAGDPTVLNPLGYAINLQGQGPSVIVDLRSTDVGVDPAAVIGSGRGINATNTAGDTQVRMNEGSVNAAAGFGINATSAGGGDTLVYLTNGTTVTATGTAVRALSNGGTVDIITTGLVTSGNEGIFANGTAGVTISAGDINAGTTGISATSTGGVVDVTTTGNVSGATGIVTNSGANNNTIVTLGANVTGTAGAGITGTVGDADYTLNATGVTITGTGAAGVSITSNGNGLVTLNLSDVTGNDGVVVDGTTGVTDVTVVSDGLVTGVTGAGVDVTANGAVSITVNDTNSVGYGAIGVSANGNATVVANGALNGGGGIAAITNGSGAAFALVQAGATINANDGVSYGALAFATGGGNAIVTLAGDVTDGGIGGFAVGAGTVDITGDGNVAMLSTFSAVAGSTDAGLLFVNLTGDVTSTDSHGFDLFSTNGPITVFSGGVVTAGDDGVNAISFTGSVNININGSVTATDTGVLVITGGAGVANINGSVTGATGVDVTGAGTGTATINLGGLSTVEATGAGFGAVATTTGSGAASISTGGSVLDGGIGAFALGTGNVSVTGAGSINNTGAGPAVSTTSTTGTTTVNLTGPITSTGGDGINALTDSGALTVGSTGAITAGTDGIQAVSTSGFVTVNTGGTIGAGATGITATSDGGVEVNNGAVITAVGTGIVASGSGNVDVGATANVTGAIGIDVDTSGGAGTALVEVDFGVTVTGTAGDGVQVTAADGGASVNNFGDIAATGGDGVDISASGLGNVLVFTGPGNITATGVGVLANTSGSGDVLVFDFGGTITGTSGIDASAGGTGGVLIFANNIVATAGDGINATATTGAVTIIANGTIDATGGDGINASTSAGGSVDVSGSGAIAGSADWGILVTQLAGGNIDINYTGNIGTAVNPTTDGGILGIITGGAGMINVTATGDVFTNGADLFGVGVGGANLGTGGAVNVSYQGTMVSGTVGVAGGIFGATNADGVTVTVGDGSTITAGSVGVLASNEGLGTATTVIGSDVTIDPDDYGSYTFSAANDATATIGNNVVIVIGNTDGDNVAYGVYAESGQAADDAVGDESTEITIGTGASITIDDGAGGDADGAGGVIGVASGAAGSVAITVGDGLNVSITGNNAVGVGGTSLAGDVTIVTGTGTIDILGLDNLDLTANFPGTAGIGAQSSSGNILIQSATSIAVNNGLLDAAGIFAETGGAGGATVVSTAQILSSGAGISAEAVDGDVVVNSSAFIGAFGGNGIQAVNSGTGNTSVFSTASVTSTFANGIVALNTGTDGFVLVAASGGTINAGFDGIVAVANNAANTQIVQVNNSDAINANTTGGGGFGIFGVQAGSGSLVIDNSGAIGGTAVSGIVGLNTNALGQIAIVNTGAIGSVGDPVTSNGIIGTATGGASINIQSNGGGIWSEFTGIRGNSISTGAVAVGTTAASPITVTGAGGAGIWVNTLGGTAQVANNAVIVSAGAGIIATNTTGTITVGTSATVTATGGDAIFTSGTTGATTILANAALSGSDDGIDATVTNAALTVTNNSTVTGADNGILTSNGGIGITTLNVNGNVTASGAGSAAINAATTGTGAVNVLIANGRTIQDVNGSAIRTTSGGGAVTINTGTASTIVGSGVGAGGWVVDLNNAVGGTTTFNVGAGTIIRSTDNTTAGYDDNAIRGIGGSVIINNAGRINGRVLFSGLTGNVVFNNSSITSWHTTGASTFSAGADVLNNTGAIFTNAGGVATSFDFGAGVDTFTQAGLLVVGEPVQGAATLTITNLEALNNSGRIVFGSAGVDLNALSDGQINDRILASGTTFTGSGSSRLVMDASLGAVVQTSCAVLTAADCLSLTGGSTAGSTLIKVTDASGSPFGALNPVGIVLVDVAGAGATAATHFSLDPTSSFWRADLNSADGVLDKGLFFYDLTLNLNKQHVLVGLPDSEAFEFTTFGAALQNVWHTTTGVWFERQADLRTQLPALDDSGAGIWVKVVGSSADRDRIQGYDLFGVTYNFDTSYEQNTVALIGGLDFMGGGSGKAWVIGGQFGFVDSDVTYDNSPTLTSFEGTTFGVYGTYVAGPWFVDGIINANMLDYDHQAITLAPVGSNIFSGSVDSLGFQVEGGWSVPLGANGFFEPLGSLSYVTTDVDAVDVPGAEVDFDSFTSLRASIGGRIGVDVDHGTFSSKWALVARYWNEFEGENDVTFHSAGPDFTLTDDFSGGFGEIGATVNVFGADDRFSAFLNVGTKFQDDYKSVDGSIGLRWRW